MPPLFPYSTPTNHQTHKSQVCVYVCVYIYFQQKAHKGFPVTVVTVFSLIKQVSFAMFANSSVVGISEFSIFVNTIISLQLLFRKTVIHKSFLIVCALVLIRKLLVLTECLCTSKTFCNH